MELCPFKHFLGLCAVVPTVKYVALTLSECFIHEGWGDTEVTLGRQRHIPAINFKSSVSGEYCVRLGSFMGNGYL